MISIMISWCHDNQNFVAILLLGLQNSGNIQDDNFTWELIEIKWNYRGYLLRLYSAQPLSTQLRLLVKDMQCEMCLVVS